MSHFGLGPCTHPRKSGQKRCRECDSAYHRQYRPVAAQRKLRKAQREGGRIYQSKLLAKFEHDYVVSEIIRCTEVD